MKKNLQKIGKTITGLLVATVLMVGCTKEFDPDLPPDPNAPNNQSKLSKITYDDGSSLSIQYNAAGHPNKMTTVAKTLTTDDVTVFQLAYNGDKLTEISASDGTKFKYTYTGANITKVELFAPNDISIGYYEYTYKDGRLWRTDLFSALPGQVSTTPSMRFELDYYTNGNIKTTTSWYKNINSGVLEKSDVYEMETYDNKRNTSLLFESNPYLPALITMPNNPLTEKHYNATGQQFASVTHTYTYDNQGNPIKRKTVTKETGQPDDIAETIFQY